jgi:hypothetical protein
VHRQQQAQLTAHGALAGTRPERVAGVKKGTEGFTWPFFLPCVQERSCHECTARINPDTDQKILSRVNPKVIFLFIPVRRLSRHTIPPPFCFRRADCQSARLLAAHLSVCPMQALHRGKEKEERKEEEREVQVVGSAESKMRRAGKSDEKNIDDEDVDHDDHDDHDKKDRRSDGQNVRNACKC